MLAVGRGVGEQCLTSEPYLTRRAGCPAADKPERPTVDRWARQRGGGGEQTVWEFSENAVGRVSSVTSAVSKKSKGLRVNRAYSVWQKHWLG